MTAPTASHEELGSPRIEFGHPRILHLCLPRLINEQDEPMRLLVSWLMGNVEGANLYSGTGGDAVAHPIPAGATGYRLRRWPSEGLAPEYLDYRFEA